MRENPCLFCVFQSDMQKVLRHARKLPDKQQQFYKVSIVNIIVLHLGNMSSVTSILNVKVSRLSMSKSSVICPKSAAHILCMFLQM